MKRLTHVRNKEESCKFHINFWIFFFLLLLTLNNSKEEEGFWPTATRPGPWPGPRPSSLHASRHLESQLHEGMRTGSIHQLPTMAGSQLEP